MFTRHRHGPIDEPDWPHALGTNAFSPQWAKSFRHFLLLTSPHSTPSLRSVAQGQAPVVYHRREPTNLRIRVEHPTLNRKERDFRIGHPAMKLPHSRQNRA